MIGDGTHMVTSSGKGTAVATRHKFDGHPESWELTLGFLIGDVARILRRAVDRRMRRKGITRAQWMILSRVSSEHGIIQKDLAAALDLTKYAVTEPLRRLEENGWIERRDDPKDGRLKRVFLTKAGGALVRHLRDMQREVTHARAAPLGQRLGLQLIEALRAMKKDGEHREKGKFAG
jgi:DNA-binding MarR family transcriptional regulator